MTPTTKQLTKEEILSAIKQLLRFISSPIWLPIALILFFIAEIWKLCEECPSCGWQCNCPKGFGTN